MTKAFVKLHGWKPCEILRGPYDFKNAYRVRLGDGSEIIVPGEDVLKEQPLSPRLQSVADRRKAEADRRKAEADKRAEFCAEVLKAIGKTIRLGELIFMPDKNWRGIDMKLRFWPEFKHLKREWRGRKLWIVNKNYESAN